MKKVLLPFIFVFFFNYAKSQVVFCPPGATWNYVEKGIIAGIDGIMEFKYTNDVMVNGINCKLIQGSFKGSRIGYTINGNAGFQNVVDYKVYENNKVIYLYNGSSFDTIINFNAVIGDKWRELYRAQSVRCSNRRGYYTVIDTSHITINNISLKRIQAAYYKVPLAIGIPSVLTFTTYFVERLMFQGSIFNTYGDLFSYYCNYNDINENPSFYLLCYHDDTFSTYQTSARNCDDLTGITNTKSQSFNIQLYPNPTNGLLTINFESADHMGNCEIKLIDVLGVTEILHLNKSKQIGEIRLDLSPLQNGIYFLQVWDHGKLIANEKVLKD